MDPVTPRSGRRRRRILRALVGIVAFVVIVLSCIEIAYQLEVARLPMVPDFDRQFRPSLPPLVIKSAAVHLFDTANPQMRPIYPWTAVFAIAKTLLGDRPRLTPAELAAWAWLVPYEPDFRSRILAGIQVAVLATWISRHVSASEAISDALEFMQFDVPGGIEQAARRYFGKSPLDLDAEETAELLILFSSAGVYQVDYVFRAERNALLRKMHEHGVIDEPTMLAAIERDVRRFK